MAATPFPPPLDGSFSHFNIFNDGGAPRNTPPPANPGLPGGPCNFVDLSHGPNGPKCGCRRFWGRQVAGAGANATDQAGWCMCSHHACFHDDGHNTQVAMAPPAPVVDNIPGQENEKPRSNRAPLSPVQDFASFQMPSSLAGAAMDFAALNFDSFASNRGFSAPAPPAIPSVPAHDNDSMPDTLSWRNVLSTQGCPTPLPPIPSQCLIPDSQSASTTASSQMRYLRPFGGVGLNTLSSVTPAKEAAQVGKGTDATPEANVDGQNQDDAITIPSGVTTPTPGPSQVKDTAPGVSNSALSPDNHALQNLSEAVEDHSQRLDKLENGSIYHTAHEDCSDKHDMTDLRVTELETRMDDAERRLNDDTASTVSTRRITQRDDDATVSDVSISSNATVRAAERAALTSHLEALQARVNKLEASTLPSYTSPWEVEVVLLPFPLKGIWLEAQDFKTPRLSGGRDEWTPGPNTNSRATPEPRGLASYDDWVGQGTGWLLPRACAPGRLIDQRLKSRGLIKKVQVRGGDARSVQLAIGNAFQDVLRMSPEPTSPKSLYASDLRVHRLFGLQQSWVPLRKVHKDSRLRFLSPPELLTPALWNATFLMDSVVMKATGMHRLYITHPEAYLQDNQSQSFFSSHPGWTWQKLRELDRVYSDSQTSNGSFEVPEADAMEEYWAFNARLDDHPSARQSITSIQQSHEKAVSMSRTTDGSTEQYFTVPSHPTSSIMSPVTARGQSPFTQRERQRSRPPFVRTGSMPPVSAPIVHSLARSSRRMSSFAIMPPGIGPSYQRHASPLVTGRPSPRLSIVSNAPAVAMITKHRHRNTRSPSLRLHNTPRWSNRSFSRSPSVNPMPYQHAHPEEPIRGDRRTTPMAYMTPYSNAPPEYPNQLLHPGRSYHVHGDDELMEFDDDHGSSTDPYGGESDGDMADEDDPDVDVYEDEADMLDDLESGSDGHHHPAGQSRRHREQNQSSQPRGPEDIPWQGIEDNNMSDGENLDPRDAEDDGDHADDRSDVSSQPSEYPSTQRAWRVPDVGEGREMTHALEDDAPGGIGFTIHEDPDGEESEPEAQNLW
ncbi:hypothetical protein N8I77_002449 [Diaporthe amygdali]|uniref:Uncharacterized protein n=1 Tax=Phomopsis amygdali TaxID=1214568 RepID=A0AAD9SU26_PHOAM|nr:hypothetical protein N8I77_002449 [Diaporthe amygdali]